MNKKSQEELFNLLHDREIIAVEKKGADIYLTMDITYHAELIVAHSHHLILQLQGCDLFVFQTWEDHHVVTNYEDITHLKPQVMSCEVCDSTGLRIYCLSDEDYQETKMVLGGILILQTKSIKIMNSGHNEITLSMLRETAKSYWESLGTK